MDYKWLYIFSYIVVGILILILFFTMIYYVKFFKVFHSKDVEYKKGEKEFKYIVLVPARNESNVIHGILSSLKAQTYNKDKFDVYVITEKLDDPTNEIAKSYGYHFIVRQNLTNRKTKGFALEEGVNYLKDNNIDYDSLIIFDADNILEPNYIEKLNDVKNENYEIGVGVRISTNPNATHISGASALLFTFQSVFTNKARFRLFEKVTISGTGYYIDKKIIDDAGGWIWTGLTEDVEITRYAYRHGIKMGYNHSALYYDEQPTDFKTLHSQHVRWIWGYINKGMFSFYSRKKPLYRKTSNLAKREYAHSMNMFINTEVFFAIHIAFSLVLGIVQLTLGDYSWALLSFFFIILDIIFILLVCDFATLVELIVVNRVYKNIKPKYFLKLTLLGFIFWGDFLLALLDGFFFPKKRKSRKQIRHTGITDNKNINK